MSCVTRFSSLVLLSVIFLGIANSYRPLRKLEIKTVKTPRNCLNRSKKYDVIRTHYNLTGMKDGSLYDASVFHGGTFDFQLGGGWVISGYDQGLYDMCEGERRELLIPTTMAYGSRGQGKIPPYADLRDMVELVEIISFCSPYEDLMDTYKSTRCYTYFEDLDDTSEDALCRRLHYEASCLAKELHKRKGHSCNAENVFYMLQWGWGRNVHWTYRLRTHQCKWSWGTGVSRKTMCNATSDDLRDQYNSQCLKHVRGVEGTPCQRYITSVRCLEERIEHTVKKQCSYAGIRNYIELPVNRKYFLEHFDFDPVQCIDEALVRVPALPPTCHATVNQRVEAFNKHCMSLLWDRGYNTCDSVREATYCMRRKLSEQDVFCSIAALNLFLRKPQHVTWFKERFNGFSPDKCAEPTCSAEEKDILSAFGMCRFHLSGDDQQSQCRQYPSMVNCILTRLKASNLSCQVNEIRYLMEAEWNEEYFRNSHHFRPLYCYRGGPEVKIVPRITTISTTTQTTTTRSFCTANDNSIVKTFGKCQYHLSKTDTDDNCRRYGNMVHCIETKLKSSNMPCATSNIRRLLEGDGNRDYFSSNYKFVPSECDYKGSFPKEIVTTAATTKAKTNPCSRNDVLEEFNSHCLSIFLEARDGDKCFYYFRVFNCLLSNANIDATCTETNIRRILEDKSALQYFTSSHKFNPTQCVDRNTSLETTSKKKTQTTINVERCAVSQVTLANAFTTQCSKLFLTRQDKECDSYLQVISCMQDNIEKNSNVSCSVKAVHNSLVNSTSYIHKRYNMDITKCIASPANPLVLISESSGSGRTTVPSSTEAVPTGCAASIYHVSAAFGAGCSSSMFRTNIIDPCSRYRVALICALEKLEKENRWCSVAGFRKKVETPTNVQYYERYVQVRIDKCKVNVPELPPPPTSTTTTTTTQQVSTYSPTTPRGWRREYRPCRTEQIFSTFSTCLDQNGGRYADDCVAYSKSIECSIDVMWKNSRMYCTVQQFRRTLEHPSYADYFKGRFGITPDICIVGAKNVDLLSLIDNKGTCTGSKIGQALNAHCIKLMRNDAGEPCERYEQTIICILQKLEDSGLWCTTAAIRKILETGSMGHYFQSVYRVKGSECEIDRVIIESSTIHTPETTTTTQATTTTATPYCEEVDIMRTFNARCHREMRHSRNGRECWLYYGVLHCILTDFYHKGLECNLKAVHEYMSLGRMGQYFKDGYSFEPSRCKNIPT